MTKGKAITLSIPALRKLEPCPKNYGDAHSKLRAYRKRGPYSAADAKAAGVSFEDVVWAASAVAIESKDVERRLSLWIADCAARVLHIYEKTESSDAPRNVIIAARRFARGEIDAAARAAARAAAWDAAWAAASDAAWDAAWATATAAARAAAWDAARAAAWAAALDAARAAARGAVWDAEEAWQYDRLIEWLSDEEPADWPLPEKKEK